MFKYACPIERGPSTPKLPRKEERPHAQSHEAAIRVKNPVAEWDAPLTPLVCREVASGIKTLVKEAKVTAVHLRSDERTRIKAYGLKVLALSVTRDPKDTDGFFGRCDIVEEYASDIRKTDALRESLCSGKLGFLERKCANYLLVAACSLRRADREEASAVVDGFELQTYLEGKFAAAHFSGVWLDHYVGAIQYISRCDRDSAQTKLVQIARSIKTPKLDQWGWSGEESFPGNDDPDSVKRMLVHAIRNMVKTCPHFPNEDFRK